MVVDPKGGVLGQVGGFLQKRGYKIKVFNSIDFSKSMHYNPLAYIRNEADILKFVDALISNTKGEGKEGDPFWTKSETLLYCALIAYIIFEGPAEDRNMNTLVDMISGMEVKEDDEDFMNAVDYMFAGLEKRKPDCFAVKQYKKYKLASGKTAKSILISCGARLAPFDIPQLREVMAYDELELDRIGDRKTAVFFIISDTTQTYNFLVALAFSQMFNLLCERADNVHGGRLPHHVRVLWDELIFKLLSAIFSFSRFLFILISHFVKWIGIFLLFLCSDCFYLRPARIDLFGFSVHFCSLIGADAYVIFLFCF